MSRPALTKTISIDDFENFYWLKEELINFCRSEGIARSGSKIDLANRINHYLKTGQIPLIVQAARTKNKQEINWNTAILTKETLLSDNYKNTENVRAFFEKEIGGHFKFSIHFMKWMRENIGKNLGNAIAQWHQLEEEKKTIKKKVIAPQFEYNTYIRDFLAAQTQLTLKDAIRCWKWKKQQKGHNRYEVSDILKGL